MPLEDVYDRAGHRIDMATFRTLRGQPDYKRVAATTLEDGTWISTVWLGMDHGFGEGPPLLFETMIFEREGGKSLDIVDRYATEAEACAGHDAMVEAYKRGDFT